jgi:glycosyltransferase involved in cell wall biosynthesis
MAAMETNTSLTVSVIVPARNEECCLATCLESLVTQTGEAFEIIVVDDHSTDRTHEIAESFQGVKVIEAGPLPEGWTGKNNAVATGARGARGGWLLFTDSDTVHLAGSLARAMQEAREHDVEMLSYSPEQIAVTFWEMATLPVVFAELAREYPPSKVSDPKSPAAAANGQYILIKRSAYDAVGGHAAVAGEILEDVALARAVKTSGRKIRFRYAADAVRTRMYRNFAELREGWTKNLALLFPSPRLLATWRLFEFDLMMLSLSIMVEVMRMRHSWLALLYLTSPAAILWRMSRAHFPWLANLLSFFGLPVFAYLLLRSQKAHASGNVAWKGRLYAKKGKTDEKGASRKGARRGGLLRSGS